MQNPVRNTDVRAVPGQSNARLVAAVERSRTPRSQRRGSRSCHTAPAPPKVPEPPPLAPAPVPEPVADDPEFTCNLSILRWCVLLLSLVGGGIGLAVYFIVDSSSGSDPYGGSRRLFQMPFPKLVQEHRLSELRAELSAARELGVELPSVDVVVARYQEDASWLADLAREVPSAQIYIYEKGPMTAGTACDVVPTAKCSRLTNVGREGHTFLSHIVDHYDNLADKTVFVQGGKPGVGFYGGQEGGHLMPGADFLYDYVSPLRPAHIVFTWAYRNAKNGELSLRRSDYPSNSPAISTNESPTRCGEQWSVASNTSTHFWNSWKRSGVLGIRQDDGGEEDQLDFWNKYLAEELGPAPAPYLVFANGATFSAHGSALRGHTREFYARIRDSLRTLNPINGFYIEFYWPYIVGFDNEARQCGLSLKLPSNV